MDQTENQPQQQKPSTGMLIGMAIFTALIVSLITGGVFYTTKTKVGAATTGTGVVGVEVAGDLGIEVDTGYNAINFGTLSRGSNADTLPPATGSGKLPFLIRNMGNIMVDVEVCAAPLWSGASKTAADYKFSVTDSDPRVVMDNCVATPCFNKASSPTTPTPVPLGCPVGTLAVNNLNFEDSKDEAIVHIYLHVPMDEPAGAKSSVTTFSAVSATTHP